MKHTKVTLLVILLAIGLAGVMLASCSRQKEHPDTPMADYTVILYGTISGAMDSHAEDMWKETQALLTDKRVRMIVFYKYGMEGESFSGKYGDPGEVVFFELDKDTQFGELREKGSVNNAFPLYDPETLKAVLNTVKAKAPAREYVLAFCGHGGGFNPYTDYPKEYYTRGFISDEYLDGVVMDVFELKAAIRQSDIPHLKGILFNNCLMGGMETVTEIAGEADYIIATPFLLTSEEEPLIPNLVRQLRQNSDFETAACRTLEDSQERILEGHRKEAWPANGNVELLKTAGLEGVCASTRELAARLLSQYPAQQEAIDRATCQVYKFWEVYSSFDLLDYARQLSLETGDAQFAAIYKQMEEAFGKAIVKQITIELPPLPSMPSYSLSVILVNQTVYLSESPLGPFTFKDAYERTQFHAMTNWGSWLQANLTSPQGNPHGQ